MQDLPPDATVLWTPAWLRVPAFGAIVGLSLYFAAGFHYALDFSSPAWIGFGSWSMFTTMDRYNFEVLAEIKVDGEWQALDLKAVFPYQWESGYRFERRHIRRSKRNLGIMAQAACGRSGLEPRAIRFQEVRWLRTPGSFDQPRRGLKKRDLGSFRCRSKP